MSILNLFRKAPEELCVKELNNLIDDISVIKRTIPGVRYLTEGYSEWRFPYSKARINAAKELRKRGYRVRFSRGNTAFAKVIHIEW